MQHKFRISCGLLHVHMYIIWHTVYQVSSCVIRVTPILDIIVYSSSTIDYFWSPVDYRIHHMIHLSHMGNSRGSYLV